MSLKRPIASKHMEAERHPCEARRSVVKSVLPCLPCLAEPAILLQAALSSLRADGSHPLLIRGRESCRGAGSERKGPACAWPVGTVVLGQLRRLGHHVCMWRKEAVGAE